MTTTAARRSNRFALHHLAAAAALLATGTAQAQTASSGTGAADQTITVTATRVLRPGFTAPTPTTSLSAVDLQARGAANVADVLNELPAFRATTTPTGGSNGTFLASQSGANLVDLRGLGASRTLVLINGRRHVPTNASGSMDLNLIPSVLIGQVETVTGGASAAWGSDAVAGVVNIGLRNKLQGAVGDLSYGWSQQGDGKETKVALAAGTAFAGGRGHVLLGGEYVDSGSVGDFRSRDWGNRQYGLLTNPANATNGQPRNIIGGPMHFATQNTSGLVASGALRGLTFDYNPATRTSSSRPFQYGQTFGASANMFGGEGTGVMNNTWQLLKAPVERWSLFGRASYDIGDSLNAWVELSAAGVHAQSTNAPPRANYTIRRDNAYLPADVVASMTTNSLTSISIGRFNTDWGQAVNDIKNSTQRLAAGLGGELAAGWNWDAYIQVGQTDVDTESRNNLIVANFNAALDAVASGGAVVCRNPNLVTTTPTGVARTASPGCVPVNLLGDGSTSAAALAYFMGTSTASLRTRQEVGALTLRGEPFATWAGPVSLTVGLEGRREFADQESDLVSQQNGWNSGNPKPLHGSYTVKELFAETVVPLAARQPWARSLDINAAVRNTSYSTSGGVTTWKGGLSYKPTDALLIRGTVSRDIRAPNVLELYSGSVYSQPAIVGGDGVSRFTPVFTTGNTALKPEVADTTALGFTFQPAALPGFRTSVDYFSIEMEGQITALGGQQIINRCRAGAADLCSYITWTAAGAAGGVPASIVNPNINLLGFRTSGVDLEATYRFKAVGGEFDLRLLGTHVMEFATIDTVGTVDRVGQTGVGNQSGNVGVAKWLWNLGATYRSGPMSVSAQVRHLPKGIYDAALIGPDNPAYSPTLANSVNDNTVPARTYLNLTGQFETKLAGAQVQFYAVINNLFDKDPPLVPSANVMTNAAYYDTVGRAFKLGARFKF